MIAALDISRTLSRAAKGAARVKSRILCVFDARRGYLAKYNLPVSKGAAPANFPQKPSAHPAPNAPTSRPPGAGARVPRGARETGVKGRRPR